MLLQFASRSDRDHGESAIDDDYDNSRLARITQRVRNVVVAMTEPLSPSRADFSFVSPPMSPGWEKLRRWSTHRKTTSMDSADLAFLRRRPLTLMTLPPELQITIISFLEFGDIERLRRTSKFWYAFATPRLVRSIYGPDTFRAMLIQHCAVCLTFCPEDVARIYTTPLDPGYPLSSRCVKCTVQSKDGTVHFGKKVRLGNLVDYWTCRWCGWPITANASSANPQFHFRCYDKYAAVLLAFFFLGWLQLLIGTVAAALAWHYYKANHAILGCTTAGFILTWICILVIMFRGNRVRTYHWALLMEIAIIGLWIPIIYYLSTDLLGRARKHQLPRATTPEIVTLTFTALNMLFRLINMVGNVVLICDYDRTKHYVPRIPIWRRFVNPVLTALIFWTYPQHAERKIPPDWA